MIQAPDIEMAPWLWSYKNQAETLAQLREVAEEEILLALGNLAYESFDGFDPSLNTYVEGEQRKLVTDPLETQLLYGVYRNADGTQLTEIPGNAMTVFSITEVQKTDVIAKPSYSSRQFRLERKNVSETVNEAALEQERLSIETKVRSGEKSYDLLKMFGVVLQAIDGGSEIVEWESCEGAVMSACHQVIPSQVLTIEGNINPNQLPDESEPFYIEDPKEGAKILKRAEELARMFSQAILLDHVNHNTAA